MWISVILCDASPKKESWVAEVHFSVGESSEVKFGKGKEITSRQEKAKQNKQPKTEVNIDNEIYWPS